MSVYYCIASQCLVIEVCNTRVPFILSPLPNPKASLQLLIELSYLTLTRQLFSPYCAAILSVSTETALAFYMFLEKRSVVSEINFEYKGSLQSAVVLIQTKQ